MSDDRYRFTLGDFECLAIKDTVIMGAATESLFPNIEADIYSPLLKARGENSKQVEFPCIPLAVFSDDWVLIDSGQGKLGADAGQTANILDDEDIRPEHIILTHAHSDHYGGLVNGDGAETFGNTPIYMCQQEWVMSTSGAYAEDNPQRAETIRKHLQPIERQIEPIECLNMSEILPGFSVLRLPGHTPNHIGILIESAGETLIYLSDALAHPLHLENLDWHCGYDADHDSARESRIKVAELALELNALVMAYHFEFPGLGRIQRNGDAYQWVPLES